MNDNPIGGNNNKTITGLQSLTNKNVLFADLIPGRTNTYTLGS